MKPYYQDESIELYLGDCRDVLPGMSADMVLADPPYGDTSLEWDHWPEGWVQAVQGALPDDASLWCFGSMRMHLDRRSDFAAWTYGQELIWEKHNGSGFHADRFKRVHEIALHWYRGSWGDVYKDPQYTNDARARTVRRKTRPTHTGNIEASSYTSEDGGPRLVRSVLQVRSMHGKAIHPTEKPLGILDPIIRYSCPPGGIVLDPTAGSGSTGMAARMSGRRAILIEGREDYCEAAAQRFTQAELTFDAAV
ncbi:DNA-methyltransferase [Arthrobacter agilis]|uniref:DNA-methyltransferase n=1 Tax=Arthrobacter agilis TaxID=37921 RepID=UPI0027843962|nr:site-specific DNA-methyltransferase [Arthrobacter agilis]MDQ0735311.1 site-specific DNA-methyltransferase (adenine-specific) [Arthrobacter agilis]